MKIVLEIDNFTADTAVTHKVELDRLVDKLGFGYRRAIEVSITQSDYDRFIAQHPPAVDYPTTLFGYPLRIRKDKEKVKLLCSCGKEAELLVNTYYWYKCPYCGKESEKSRSIGRAALLWKRLTGQKK